MTFIIALLALALAVALVGWRWAAEDRDMYRRFHRDADEGWKRTLDAWEASILATRAVSSPTGEQP